MDLSPSQPLPESASNDDELRSYFDNITKSCDVFRILLVGKAGSGKSTLVSEVFDFDLDKARVQDFSSAEHDIKEEITPPTKSLCLHDSKGLESGSPENLNIITDFIKDREGRPFAEQLHAIWYCIEIPIAGQRPFEGGDIALLDSLKRSGNKVPVIVVFTKIDRLEFREQKRLKSEHIQSGMDKASATAKAKQDCIAAGVKEYEKSCVGVLKSDLVPNAWTHYCAVSYKHPESIISLIQLTTSTLSDSEALNVMWASAQMADVNLKVETSLLAGKNMYWQGLGAALIPVRGIRRVTLLHILGRIHRDIVRVWNIYDPDEILVGANMRAMLRKLFIEPIMVPTLEGDSHHDAEGSKIIENLASAVMNPASMAVPAATEAIKLLESVAVGTPATARVLMAYVADLTLGLESLYWTVRPRVDKAISREDVTRAFTTYRASSQRKQVHMLIRDYIGDENVIRSFSREKAMTRVSTIIAKSRFDPATVFRSFSL
ncbi:uncharacterized protein PHACADRAFT_265240 [Phanerochaete carnosa HHB-10118-sp]|uniref:G domain-containing protein n=1 Tax=Phanerochaete carnosa (strain HHB-10118-sp) TaxID=650164 RepID=K5WHH8_PHACS|nr:uncharacterized protein PHACADRAFT_265240 [Phanerochaete carnosa HHB-10118-sp]EKM49677.1 hypothetical protein PHACADRAFT_265240 [Phanerochaete carnosa HHB-10118-sp]